MCVCEWWVCCHCFCFYCDWLVINSQLTWLLWQNNKNIYIQQWEWAPCMRLRIVIYWYWLSLLSYHAKVLKRFNCVSVSTSKYFPYQLFCLSTPIHTKLHWAWVSQVKVSRRKIEIGMIWTFKMKHTTDAVDAGWVGTSHDYKSYFYWRNTQPNQMYTILESWVCIRAQMCLALKPFACGYHQRFLQN